MKAAATSDRSGGKKASSLLISKSWTQRLMPVTLESGRKAVMAR